ncbi:hypothetical protein LJC55_02740 [Eubacteriales bacterium OttesenSCG-928-N14]|nr:hypothetical protein [Eubacteriales bacterium OttesenSCG-928-N14]
MHAKRLLVLFICILLLAVMVGCKGEDNSTQPQPTQPADPTPSTLPTQTQTTDAPNQPDHMDPGSMDIIAEADAWLMAVEVIADCVMSDPACPWNGGVTRTHTDTISAYNGKAVAYVFSLADAAGNKAGQIIIDGRNMNPHYLSHSYLGNPVHDGIAAAKADVGGWNADVLYFGGAYGIVVAKSGTPSGNWQYYDILSGTAFTADAAAMQGAFRAMDPWTGELPNIPVEDILQEYRDKYGSPGDTITPENINEWGLG